MGRSVTAPGFTPYEGPAPAGSLAYYFRTPLWASKRDAMLTLTGRRCQKCMKKADRVSHKHFRTIGHESFDDLEVLCNRCRRT